MKLLGALPIDVEQNIPTRRQRFLDRRARRAVEIAEHGRMFQQFPPIRHQAEFFLFYEKIIETFYFARAFRPRGRRDRHAQIIVP